jgi:succinoglycan biosynthesis protein ExoV
MQLYCWRGTRRNFGDELNALLWPPLLPDFFNQDPSELFLGIGSVLEARHDPAALKLVAGSGYGGYAAPPALDARWVIHWVRGPRTARVLGLPESCGLGDPALLLSAPRPADASSVGFMPHFESLARGAWAEAATAAGLVLIDPTGDPAATIAAIADCRLLLSEAMHGAIVADALRVPWIALRPLVSQHHAKWQDWADPLELQVRFEPLAASSLPERLHAAFPAASRRCRGVLGRTWPLLARARRRRFIERAAQSLALAAATSPQLSADATLARCRARMLERLDALRRDPMKPAAIALHCRTTSAYQD